MQHHERTRVLHHNSLVLHCRGCLDQISCTAGFISAYNAVTVGNSGAIWTGTGGLTISRSRNPFRTAYLGFILIEHRYSLHSDHYTRAARMNQCFVLFAGSVHSMCNDAQSRLEYIIYGSQTELAGCDEWQSRIRMEQSVDAMSLKHVQLVFPFFFFFILLILSF